MRFMKVDAHGWCAYRKAWQKSHVCRSVFGFKGQIYKTHHHTSTMESPRSNKLSWLPGEGGSWGESQEKNRRSGGHQHLGLWKILWHPWKKWSGCSAVWKRKIMYQTLSKTSSLMLFCSNKTNCVGMPIKTSAGISARAPRVVTPVLGAPLTAPSTPTAVDRYPTEVLKAWRRHWVLAGLAGLPLCHFGSPQIQP